MLALARRLAPLALLTAASVPAPDAVPGELRSYVRGGSIDPGDFAWMAGAFHDASDKQKVSFARVRAWYDKCLVDAQAEEEVKLAEAGFPNVRLDTIVAGPAVCGQAALSGSIADRSSFRTFTRALSKVRPLYVGLIVGVRLSETVDLPDAPGLRQLLERRPLGEQMIRAAMGQGSGSVAGLPNLPPEQADILQMRLSMEMLALDRANTEWLKAEVAKDGWPLLSVVGPAAAKSAWLLAQHADAEPSFQLRVLRLMRPLLARKEVDAGQYAYLYDRVMLKLTGKQRYGTQLLCSKGQLTTEPLEDEGAVDRYRNDVGLGDVAGYIGRTRAELGPCPN